MDTLKYITDKYKLATWKVPLPIRIPETDRITLAKLFNELGFTKGVEIGVDCGLYAEVLCRENPNAKIYGVDPWLAYDGYLPGPIDQAAQDRQNDDFNTCKQRMAPYNNHEIIRKTSMDALSDFEDNSLDFVYIDGNHFFEYVVNDIVGWSKKVRSGGIVSGHDYNYMSDRSNSRNNPVHVIPAVHGFTSAYKISPWFVLGADERKHWRTRPRQIRDRYRSWFWVKR